MGLVDRKGCAHGGLGGIGRRLVKHRHFQAGQRVECLLQNAYGFDALVRDD